MVDHPADLPRGAAGVSGRLRPRHADAVPADHHPDFSLGGRFFAASGKTQIAGLQRARLRGLLPADDGGPRLFEHAGAGLEHRGADSRGEMKKFLIQPIDLVGFLFISRLAHKLAYYAVATLPVRAGVLSLPRLLSRLARCHHAAGAFVASLVMGFLLGFFFEVCLGLLGFWFLEVNSLLFVYMLFSFFLSGHMFPLDMLPEPWLTIVKFTALQVPGVTSRPRCSSEDPGPRPGATSCSSSWPGCWVLPSLARGAFARGVRRYSGYRRLTQCQIGRRTTAACSSPSPATV